MKYHVYVIQSQVSDKLYIGYSANLEQRLKRHNKLLPNKNTSFTSKNKGPWQIVYKELYSDRAQAMIREKQLKSYRGRQFIKNLVKSKSEDT